MSHSSNHTAHGAFPAIIRVDETSMELIFQKFHTRLTFYALQFVKDMEVARDIVSNTYIALWEQRERLSFANEKVLSSYLYNITKYKAIDYQKKEVIARDASKGFAGLENPVEDPAERDNELILTEAIATLMERISLLSPQYRKVIEMTIEGYNTRDIAQEMNISESSVRGYKFKAIALLQKNLDGGLVISTTVFAALILDKFY